MELNGLNGIRQGVKIDLPQTLRPTLPESGKSDFSMFPFERSQIGNQRAPYGLPAGSVAGRKTSTLRKN